MRRLRELSKCRLRQRSEELYRGLGTKAGLGEALQLLGVALFYVEDLTNAEPAAREAIDLANEIGNADVRGHAELALGWILVSEQRHTDAEAVFRQALAARSDLDRWTLGMVFDGLAYIAA